MLVVHAFYDLFHYLHGFLLSIRLVFERPAEVVFKFTQPTEPAQSQYGGRLRIAGLPVDDRDNN